MNRPRGVETICEAMKFQSGDAPSRQSHERNGSGRSRRRGPRTQPGTLSRQGWLKTVCCRRARGATNRWSDGSGELSGGASERSRGQRADDFFNDLKSHPSSGMRVSCAATPMSKTLTPQLGSDRQDPLSTNLSGYSPTPLAFLFLAFAGRLAPPEPTPTFGLRAGRGCGCSRSWSSFSSSLTD